MKNTLYICDIETCKVILKHQVSSKAGLGAQWVKCGRDTFLYSIFKRDDKSNIQFQREVWNLKDPMNPTVRTEIDRCRVENTSIHKKFYLETAPKSGQVTRSYCFDNRDSTTNKQIYQNDMCNTSSKTKTYNVSPILDTVALLQCVTKDYAVFTDFNRGTLDFLKVCLESDRIIQKYSVKGQKYGFHDSFVLKNGFLYYFSKGETLCRLNIETFDHETMYTVDGEFRYRLESSGWCHDTKELCFMVEVGHMTKKKGREKYDTIDTALYQHEIGFDTDYGKTKELIIIGDNWIAYVEENNLYIDNLCFKLLGFEKSIKLIDVSFEFK